MFRHKDNKLYIIGRILSHNWLMARTDINMFGMENLQDHARTIPGTWFTKPGESYPDLQDIIHEEPDLRHKTPKIRQQPENG
ncbi:hypothetical protein D3C83_134350 [compost metagenome]